MLARFGAYVGKISATLEQRMREFMATMEPEIAETFVSTWDQIRAEARARGQAEGRARGQAELLVSQLALKFGDLDDETRAAVHGASREQIASWSARLIQGTLRLEDLTA